MATTGDEPRRSTTGNVDLGNFRIINLAAPVNPTDAVNKQYDRQLCHWHSTRHQVDYGSNLRLRKKLWPLTLLLFSF